MCGIAGLISHTPEERIGPMLEAIEHRGRDDHGVYVSQPFGEGLKACLGHRRLSIIDTSSAGHQPFLSDDKRFALTYTYYEVRAELESAGDSFATGSDTEVPLKAFRKWGVECLEKLNGMFAFTVCDGAEKEITLVRGRAGSAVTGDVPADTIVAGVPSRVIRKGAE